MSKPIHISINSPLSRLKFTIGSLCRRTKGEMHMHNYVQIWYVLSGTLVHKLNDETHLQYPGTCVTVPPHIVHSVDSSSSEDTPVAVSISFKDEFLTARGYTFCSYFDKHIIFNRYRIPYFYEFLFSQREQADFLVRAMLSAFSAQPNPSFDNLSALLTDFLGLLCVKSENSRITDRFLEQVNVVNRAIEFMEKHYSEKISLADLCTLTATTHPGFTKKFKKFTGFTSIEYLHLLRLTNARQALIFTDNTLSKIAEDVGFYDKSRLIHAFREYYGLSPTEFRNQARPLSYQQDFNSKPRFDRINNILRELEQSSDM